jgi:autotransporter-associated beta strand protein
LQLQGGITVGAEALTISGTGATGQTGALVNVSGTNTYGGPLTLGAATTISSNSGTLNLNSTVNLNSHGLTVSGTGNTQITGAISSVNAASTLTKSGSGTLTVTGANTYSGGTTVNGGTILVNNTSGSGTGTGAVTVNNNGSTLGGTGTISGQVTVNAGANLAPGNGGHTTGILTVGMLTMQPTSNYLVDINGTTPGAGYDQVKITGAGATRIALNNSNLVITVGTTLTYGDTFNFLTIANTGAFNTGEFAQGNTVTSGRYTFSISYPDYHTPDKDVTLTVVPEPGTWVGGALAVAALAYTQRRRLKKLFLLRRAYGGQVARS